MNVITWNIGGYKRKCKIFSEKFRILRELIRNESPDIYCIIEGTQSIKYNRLLKYLFKTEGYSCFYEPAIPTTRLGDFDWDSFEPYGLKIFYKNTISNAIPYLEPSSVLFKGRLIRIEINNCLFIFLHRNMSAKKYDQDQFIGQIKIWVTRRQKDRITNVFILGDFNLNIWDEKYFSENSGYIRTSVINRQFELRIRQSSGVDFFNPIIDTINKKDEINLGGTYYNKRYGWVVLDYVLVKNWDNNSVSVDLITSFGDYNLINSDVRTRNYINYNFDHIPLKLNAL